MHIMESLLSTAECRKSTKNSFQASCSGPLRAAKKQKRSPGRWRAGREQGHLLLRLRRTSSRSLVLIQPCAFFRHLQLSRRPGNLFYLFTPIKTSQKAHMVCGPVMGLAFRHMKHACSLSCSTHQPASPACTVVDLRRSLGCWLLLSSWGSHERHRHCVTREKNSFPFVLGTAAESPESSLRSYLRLPHTGDWRSIPVTGSEGGGTVSAVDYELNRQ